MPAQLPRRRHVPQRTCVVCRAERAKRELVRVVRTPDGAIKVDQTGKASGRGAYLCVDPACWHKAIGSQALDRALKIELTGGDRELLGTYARALEDTTIPQATPQPKSNTRRSSSWTS